MSEAYHASVNVICFESSVLYIGEAVSLGVLWGKGGWFAKWIARFLIG